ncbi:MAG: penicillin-binding protein 2 [Alphaproteobacteria bacterium]|nr:MAG: penicillin-binding protein 2 [Alphaproteobacteria bacterium]TAF15927.1 MAG: penicillin-binding protein 2 [Alphaproteobacteria bacterium]TAF38983.1 MAG: penicillin-binding protein 2 [Alphaproteobacteria bacterium]TAF76741.1 MAG: penicillin-binding protein 2 [Alphaproteobacteria bacterium]
MRPINTHINIAPSYSIDACRIRMVWVLAGFAIMYAILAVKMIDANKGDRSLGRLFSEAYHDIDTTTTQTVASVEMMRGTVKTEGERWQPNVPAMVMPRQSIRDRSGVLLASSVPTRSLYVRPHEIIDAHDTAQRIHTALPQLDLITLQKRITSKAKFVWLQHHLTPKEQEAVLWAGIPGVYLHDDYRRMYPHGHLMAHVLGYTDDYGKGLAGVEKSFDRQLMSDEEISPLTLSIDVRMQQALYDAVAKAMFKHQAIGAAGAIFHIPTGQARAMISLPDFDPNRPRAFPSSAHFNRLTVGEYELGSIFKTLSLAFALEHGNITMTQGYDATHPIRFQGNTIRDFHPKRRWLSVPEILVYSSNIGTVKMVQDVGMEKQRAFLHQVGLFEPVGLEIKEFAVPKARKTWKPVESATISFGHGISVTPMHLIRGMLAVNNGGEYRDVTLLDNQKKEATRILGKETSYHVNRLMRAVVQHGTASKADVKGYAVGAKTGTANKVVNGRYSTDKKLSSLIAAFPMPQPEYFVFIMLDEPIGTKDTYNYATAGWVAAPAAAEVIRAIAPMAGIPPIYFMPEDDIDRMIISAAYRAKHGVNPPYVQKTSAY